MEATLFKICPSCGAEFRPTVAECSDCGCALVHPEETAAEPEDSAADASPVRMACLARGGAWELRELAEALGERGVSTRIGPYPPPGAGSESSADEGPAGFGPSLGIYVEEGDLEDAVRLHQQLVREWSHAEPESEPEPESADGSGGADACPACGAALGPEAEACESCGLEFPPLQG